MNRKIFLTKHLILSGIATTLTSFLITVPAIAQKGGDNIGEITRLLCRDGGKIVMCVGKNPSSCEEIVRPFVEKCEQASLAVPEKERAQRFDECFQRDFYGKYGKDVLPSPACVTYPEEEGAIQPPPPEFADKGTPFPFGQPMPDTPTN